MQKIPIEYYNLNLFEQLDRPVIAFVKKGRSGKWRTFMSLLQQRHMKKKGESLKSPATKRKPSL